MSTTLLTKRPGETRLYVFDFTLFPELAAGDTLTTPPAVTATSLGPDGTAPTIGSPTLLGTKKVQVSLSGGSDETSWLMECTCPTTGGSILVCSGQLDITEGG